MLSSLNDVADRDGVSLEDVSPRLLAGGGPRARMPASAGLKRSASLLDTLGFTRLENPICFTPGFSEAHSDCRREAIGGSGASTSGKTPR